MKPGFSQRPSHFDPGPLPQPIPLPFPTPHGPHHSIPLARLFAVVLCLGLVCFAVASPPQERRWLLAIETSESMEPRKQGLYDTLENLFRSGFDRRLQPGDSIGVWTFNQEVLTGQFPLQTWSTDQGPRINQQLRAFLETRSFQRLGNPSAAVALATEVARRSAHFSLILICTGQEPISGTPFDSLINAALRDMRRTQRRTRQPVLVVLRSEHGQWIDYTVGQPPWPVQIPLTPSERQLELELLKPSPTPYTQPGPPLPLTASAASATEKPAEYPQHLAQDQATADAAIGLRRQTIGPPTNASSSLKLAAISPDTQVHLPDAPEALGRPTDPTPAGATPVQRHSSADSQFRPTFRPEDRIAEPSPPASETQGTGDPSNEPPTRDSQASVLSSRTQLTNPVPDRIADLAAATVHPTPLPPAGAPPQSPPTADSLRSTDPGNVPENILAAVRPANLKKNLNPIHRSQPPATAAPAATLPEPLEATPGSLTNTPAILTATSVPPEPRRSALLVAGLSCVLAALIGGALLLQRSRTRGGHGSLITQSYDRHPPSSGASF
jgi:hypothetical protein